MTKLQHFPTSLFQLSILAFCLLSLAACQEQTCNDITGRWTNREGRTFIVEPDGQARWLVRFGSKVETFMVTSHYDCTKDPITLDFSGFTWGPIQGKTLYAIMEWKSDTSFRFQSEPGYTPSVRPAAFSDELSVTYYKEVVEGK